MKSYRREILSSGTSSKTTSSPTTPLLKRQRRIIDESPLSQSEVCWFDDSETQLSPQRQFSVRAKSSNQLVQTPVRIVKRHVSSPAIGALKMKNLFDLDESISEVEEEETPLKKDDSFNILSDDFDFSDDQIMAVLNKVDEEEQLQKKANKNKSAVVHPAVTAVATVDVNFEDSFDDAILASIPLEELSKCNRSSVEIVYNDGLSQIVTRTTPAKSFAKNKSMEPKVNSVVHIGAKRSLERHNSLPQQPLANSTNVFNAAGSNNAPRKCTKEEIEAKKKAAQLRLAQSRQRLMKKF